MAKLAIVGVWLLLSGPWMASPVTCCHQEPVSSSRMMKFWLLMPNRRKSSVRPSSVRSQTRAVWHSVQYVLTSGTPPTVSSTR